MVNIKMGNISSEIRLKQKLTYAIVTNSFYIRTSCLNVFKKIIRTRHLHILLHSFGNPHFYSCTYKCEIT